MNTRPICLTLAQAYGRKTSGKGSRWRTTWAVFLLWAATAIAASAQIVTTLSNLNASTGTFPTGPVVQGSNGNFYGTAYNGGDVAGNIYGTVFKINPPGTEVLGTEPGSGPVSVLYNFCSSPSNCTDGANPYAPLVEGSDGNLYGTTYLGGANGFYGTVFKITPMGTLTTLYSFCALTNCADGEFPNGGLIEGSDGNFYGTTAGDGVHNFGTVFIISPQGSMRILYGFCALPNCGDGQNPAAGLVQGSDGNFYGTTYFGGANKLGTVFKITPQGTLTTLHSFASADGADPAYGSLVQGSDGNLYGTTEYGGANSLGTVFRITPQGTLTTLHSFAGADGENPFYGSLVEGSDANFYGVTYLGGTNNLGTVFRINPQGTLATLHSFAGTDGANPAGLAKASDDTFYGTTFAGGTYSAGTVFSLLLDLPALGEQVDYFRESKADFTVWRPSSGTWFTIDGSGKSLTKPWGASGDRPVLGDYDGDGKSDIAVWRPSNGTWFVILSTTGQVVEKPWGEKGDIPVPGDYDGDGKTDFAVWRPSNGTWFVIESSTGKVVEKAWGKKGDIPVPGDYDGDGKTDFAVWRPSNGTWFMFETSTGKVVEKQWGEKGDIPVPGDYDGDAKTDIAVWRPSNGTWFVIESGNGKVVEKAWGEKGDIPVARDYDGDGKTDFAVWRPSNGTWYVIATGNGKTIAQSWGVSTDIAINKPVGQ